MKYFITNLGHIQHYYSSYGSLYKYDLNDNDLIDWKNSTFGFNKTIYENSNIRKSLYAKQMYSYKFKFDDNIGKSNLDFDGFTFKYNNYIIKDFEEFLKEQNEAYYKNLVINDYLFLKKDWKLLKYDVGCKFKSHIDGIKNEKHIGTIILLPPESLSYYEGGELILYTEEEEIIVKNDEMNWIMVFIPINMKHEIKEITSGTRFSFVKPFILNDDIYYLMNNSPIDIYSIDLNKIKNTTINNQIYELKQKIKQLEDNIKELEITQTPNFIFDKEYIDSKMNDFNYYINQDDTFILILNKYIDTNNINDIDFNDYQILKIILNIKPNYETTLINCLAKINIEDIDNLSEKDYENLDTTIDNYELNDEIEYTITLPSFKKIKNFYIGTKQPGILINSYQEYNDEYYELTGNRKVSIIHFSKK